MTLIFTPLTDKDYIGKCTELLENHMQCSTTAQYRMSNPEDKTSQTRQVCRYHAKLIQANEINMKTKG